MIVVSGSSGGVGSRLIAHLQSQGYRVASLKRRRPPQSYNGIGPCALPDWSGVGDGVRAIIHLAARTPERRGSVFSFICANVALSLHVRRLAQRTGANLLVYQSTTTVEDISPAALIGRGKWKHGKVRYALTKLLGEQVFLAKGLRPKLLVVRTPAIVSAGARKNWIERLVSSLPSGATLHLEDSTDEFNHILHIDDYCAFLDHILQNIGELPKISRVTLAASCPIGIREVATLLTEHSAADITVRKPQKSSRDRAIKISSRRMLLGFEPMTVKETMLKMIREQQEY